jgi:CHAD domain-containing protein
VGASGLARPEVRSKLALALDMTSAANVVAPNDVFAEAGRKVLRRHLLRMLDREVGARAGDALAQKQMRVATRRLRATWRVFGDGFKRGVERHFGAETRPVGRAIGAVRDLDVLLGALPDDDALEPFADHLRDRRDVATKALNRLMNGKRYERFVAEMLTFSASPSAGTARRAAALTVREAAPPALAESLERVRVAGAGALGGDDAAAWHQLRIEARRFRYSVEAFADVLDKKATKDLIARIVRVQDHLGAMNDAAVAIEEASLYLAETGAEAGSPTHVALAGFIASREAEIVALRRSFGIPWRGISGAVFERLIAQSTLALVG